PVLSVLPRSPFFFSSSGAPRHLHSFPTRRSSDLFLDLTASFLARGQDRDADGWRMVRLLDPDEVPYREGSADAGEVIATNARLLDRKSTRLNSSHVSISYAVFCLKKKIKNIMSYQ